MIVLFSTWEKFFVLILNAIQANSRFFCPTADLKLSQKTSSVVF